MLSIFTFLYGAFAVFCFTASYKEYKKYKKKEEQRKLKASFELIKGDKE